MSSLSFRIREVLNNAERFLAQPEIYSALDGLLPNSNVFCVTIAQMLAARQLRRRKVTKAIRAQFPGVHFVYGPGPVAVFDREISARPRKNIGFMEEKRMREAKARRAQRARA